jgi:hypothetical protein
MFKKGSFILVASIVLIAMGSNAWAWGHRGHGGYGGHGGHGGGYYNSYGWGIGFSYPYYYGNYYNGYPYNNAYPYNYVVVETPVVHTTTVVTHASDASAPQQASTVAPKTSAQSTAQVEAIPKDSATLQQQMANGDTTTIYVPNSAGRFTPVKLVKRGNGYTGPQGEFYPHSPTVAQLKVLYSY